MILDLSPRTLARMEQVEDQLRSMLDRGQISLESLVNLLLDHWSTTPPTKQWARDQANLYPADNKRRHRRR